MEKSRALLSITKAGEITENDRWSGGYTCWNLFDSEFPYTEAYWDIMFQSGEKRGIYTVLAAWHRNGWMNELNCCAKSIKNHRLMMLAWLYEMVRSGEFTRITGVRFTK